MRIRRQITILTIALVTLCVSTGVLMASAQDTGTRATPSASPGAQAAPRFGLVAGKENSNGYFEGIEISPGESETLTVQAVNTGEIPLSLVTYKVNALNGVNGGYASGQEGDEPFGSNAWVDYPSHEVDLEPGAHQDITFTVSVPQDAESGQYISGLVIELSEPMPIPGTEIMDQLLGYAIALEIIVPGEMTHAIDLGAPDVALMGADRFVEVPITNTGNYLVRPQGELRLTNDAGDDVLKAPVDMGSVYAGNSTIIDVPIPDQMQPGDYTVNLTLTDEASGAVAEVKGATVTVKVSEDPTGVSITSASIVPNADPIAFANVDLTIDNGGSEIPAANVSLDVLRNGEQVDNFPLATKQVLVEGKNQITARYIPAEAWESGTYTFRIAVSAVDPNGGQETVLLTEDLDATIVVP